ncbi:MAG: lytic murein transglycosylase [Syntrophaceae bacterium]|nr:lytic murein transglycosylase [Syntrophaceae bacterium]
MFAIQAAPLKRLRYTLISLLCCAGLILLSPAMARPDDFSRWLEDFQAEARAAGISPNITQLAFAKMKGPVPRVIKLDRHQPETTQSCADYLAARVTPKRVKLGEWMLKRYPTWLGRIERKYAVQRRFVVALWGIETNYGEHTGRFPVIHALATLAYDGRRGTYFRRELMQALRILDAGHISLSRMRGSWSGAMGQCQFMPSTFARHAVDADSDGRIDIWGSIPDALASAANYLAAEKWRSDQTWGRPVRLPAGFAVRHAGLENRLPLAAWHDLGIRRFDGGRLPRRDLEASLVMPDGPKGPAYLVYDNFRVLMRWNRSVSFAVAVGTLVDRITVR